MSIKIKKVDNLNTLPMEKNPFKTKETLKKYGKYDGDDTGFIDAGIVDDELY